MTDTRTPIVWDKNDSAAWLRNPLAETQRHRDALTVQWPSDMRMAYMPQSGVVHMVPEGERIEGFTGTFPLCGTEHHGMVEMSRVEATPCTRCTEAYNMGVTTGIPVDPFPVGTEVEFDTMLGDTPRTMRGVVVERTPAFRGFRRVQVNPAGLCTEIRVENLKAVQ
jgi:hypothetical protein